ncbi:stalk domain-containing protein [Tepidibacillus infernus]|uniref:stalk domain-containing protein n=1 Tax=Tepidibacillus infernus TaxID=1806172 RepID=UPI003B6E4B41
MKKRLQILAKVTTVLAMLLSMFPSIHGAIAAESVPSGNLVSSEWITAGAKLEKWNWKTSTGIVKINLIEVDLKNPYIKVDTMVGKEGMTGNKQRPINMAKETGAVAAVNGDFFTLAAEGAPFGATIQNGQMITSPGYIHSKNALMIDQNGVPFIDRLDFDAEVTTEDGSKFQLYGVNKTQYNSGFRFSGNSHQNRLHMYTDKWNMKNWVGDALGEYTIVLVENGIVTQMLDNQAVDEIPNGAYLLLGHGEAQVFLKQHVRIGETIQVDFKLNPDQKWLTAIDGSTLLVDEGQKAKITYEIKGNHARTAVGYSQDKRYLYLVTAEKSKNSVGMTLDELSTFLIHRGVWKAVNLDGGGSTTMVARGLGTFNLSDVTIPQYGVEREVPNALAIFSTAPKGKLLGGQVSLPKGALQGETLTAQITRAYDEYYNPIDPKEVSVQWDVATGVQQNKENPFNFIFNQQGTFNIKSSLGQTTQTHQIKVYSKEDLKLIKIDQDIIRINTGESLKPTVTMSFTDGSKRSVDTKLLKWQLIGAKGSVQADGTVTGSEASVGMLIASYQGFSTAVPVVIGTQTEGKVIDQFDQPGIYLIQGLKGIGTGSFKSGIFTYDFGNSSDLRIVYLQYGTVGKYVRGEPAFLTLDVKGDNSGHWLRTEIRDKNGKVYYVDLAKKVDWIGWKTLTVPVPKGVAYPLTLKSIYVVHQENATDQTPNQGQLSFANLQIKEWNKAEIAEKPTLKFTLNQKQVLVGNEKKSLDQAPIIVNGRTFLPLRAFSELLGGQVNWFSSEQKAEAINDYKVLDFWLEQSYMSQNGERKALDVAPFVRNGRTMLPVRALSEGFGLYIYYDSKTQSITVN